MNRFNNFSPSFGRGRGKDKTPLCILTFTSCSEAKPKTPTPSIPDLPARSEPQAKGQDITDVNAKKDEIAVVTSRHTPLDVSSLMP